MKYLLIIIIAIQSYVLYDVKTVLDQKSEAVQFWIEKYYKTIETDYTQKLSKVLVEDYSRPHAGTDSHRF